MSGAAPPNVPGRLARRTLLAAAALVAAGCRAALPRENEGSRVVSLAPGITDTLFTIGAGAQVVARSDYCDYPEAALALPRVGSNLTPNYELITRLRPTLIVGEANAATRRRELEAIGSTLLLPWLSLEEIVASTRELGRKTHTEPAAGALAAELERRLAVPEPRDGPRVLLVIGYQPGKLDEIWFFRKNSLHGAALHAAGARNAVPDAVSGPPRLTPERLVELDPDAIFVLARPGSGDATALDAFRALTPVRAVKRNALAWIEAPEAYSHGPRMLSLVDRLARAVEKVRAAP